MTGKVLLSIDDGDPIETDLDAFLGENTFDPEERAEIVEKVADGDIYFGGGGAAPGWVIGAPPAISAWLADIRA